MNKLLKLVSLVCALGIVGVIAITYLNAAPLRVPLSPSDASLESSARITWSSPTSQETLSPGEVLEEDLTFISNLPLQNVVLEAVPEISGFITMKPNHFPTVPAGQLQSVHISYLIPPNTTLGSYSGTIHLRVGSKTYPQTMKIVVNVWNSIGDPTSGFSTLYPPNLYNLSSSTISSGIFSLESSPQGVAIGGDGPEDGSNATTSGFAVIIEPKPYPGTFDINAWIAAADADLGSLTITTIAGSAAYEITFKNQVGAGRPTVIVYHDGYLFQISYASTFAPGSVDDQTGLAAFDTVLQNFRFSH